MTPDIYKQMLFKTKFYPCYILDTRDDIPLDVKTYLEYVEINGKIPSQSFTFIKFIRDIQQYEITNSYNIDIKHRNIAKAVTYAYNTERVLSVYVIKKIHYLLCKDVIPDPGEYRTIDVKPSLSNTVYTYNKYIDVQVVALVEFYNSNIKLCYTLSDRIILATMFMSELLLIHPFSNGNGRLSRVILYYLLKDVSKTPFTICNVSRSTLIELYEERCLDKLATCVLLSMFDYIEVNSYINV